MEAKGTDVEPSQKEITEREWTQAIEHIVDSMSMVHFATLKFLLR